MVSKKAAQESRSDFRQFLCTVYCPGRGRQKMWLGQTDYRSTNETLIQTIFVELTLTLVWLGNVLT